MWRRKVAGALSQKPEREPQPGVVISGVSSALSNACEAQVHGLKKSGVK